MFDFDVGFVCGLVCDVGGGLWVIMVCGLLWLGYDGVVLCVFMLVDGLLVVVMCSGWILCVGYYLLLLLDMVGGVVLVEVVVL